MSIGRSSALMRQSNKYITQAVKPTNVLRGLSSVIGSGISGICTIGYNEIKNLWGW